MWEKFLNWIHTHKVGDVQVIVGGEIIATAIALTYVFYTSDICKALIQSYYFIFLGVNLGLGTILVGGLVLLVYGIIIKLKNKQK